MGQITHATNVQPQPGLEAGGLKLPTISPERKETLASMSARINAFAQNLFRSHEIFLETKQQTPGSAKAKAELHHAKEHLDSALHELRSIHRLISLNPQQVYHLATPINRASQQIARIKRFCDRVLSSTTTEHHSRALDALARSCPRASYELENSLWVPLKQALEGQALEGQALKGADASDTDPPKAATA